VAAEGRASAGAEGFDEAVQCDAVGAARLSGVEEVRYWSYSDKASLDEQWNRMLRAQTRNAPVTRTTDGGCWDGTPGATDHEAGRVQCDLFPNGSWAIHWDDPSALVYGRVRGDGASDTNEARVAALRAGIAYWSAAVVPGGATPRFDEQERVLLEAVPQTLRGTCVPRGHTEFTSRDEPVTGINYPRGDVAAIICYPDRDGILYVGYYLMGNRGSLSRLYEARNGSLQPHPNACFDDKPGDNRRVDRRQLFCFQEADGGPLRTYLRWSDVGPADRGPFIYGLVNAKPDVFGIRQLTEWWDLNVVPAELDGTDPP
jgi:hypothetical protein